MAIQSKSACIKAIKHQVVEAKLVIKCQTLKSATNIFCARFVSEIRTNLAQN